MEALAQAVSSLAPIAPIRNDRRTVGGALGRGGTGLSGSSHVERNALAISRDRARIVSSAQSALGLIRGKWKISILVTMRDGPVRLGQLRRLIPRVSKKVLVQQLRELERDEIIVRTDRSRKIKHVEYTVCAPLGRAVMNLLELLSDWGIRHTQTAPLGDRTPATESGDYALRLNQKLLYGGNSGLIKPSHDVIRKRGAEAESDLLE
jgi:DNA-binding HxlR family transcriptional regulator